MRRTGLASLIMLASLGCQGGEEGSPEPRDDRGMGISTDASVEVPDASVTGTRIGAAGGVVTASDGARVEIAAGALAAEVMVTIREVAAPMPPGLSFGSAVYEISPSGTQLAVPARITLPANVGGDDRAALIVTFDEAAGEWVTAGSGDDEDSLENDLDLASGTVSAYVTHFSRFAVVAPRLSPEMTLEAAGKRVAVRELLGCPPRARSPRPAGTSPAKVVLHSTVSAPTRSVISEACAEARAPAAAHYVVGRDGRIVQLYDPASVAAPHAKGREHCGEGCSGTRALNDLTVGIELVNASSGTVEQTYTGAQMASAVKLVRYLLARFGLATPPSMRALNSAALDSCVRANTYHAHGDTSVVYHREIDGCRGAKRDPVGPWREDAFFAALRDIGDGRPDPGKVYGEAMIQHRPGPLPEAAEAPHLIVPRGQTRMLSAENTSFGDVIIDGELVINGAVTLRVRGSFYVGPSGRVRAPGGGALIVDSAGLAVVSGEVTMCAGAMGGAGRFTIDSRGDLLPEPVVSREGGACTGGTWNLRFSPMIDLSACGSQARWDLQSVGVMPDGTIDAAINSIPPVVRLRGTLTATSVAAAASCVSSGAGFGSVAAAYSPITGDYPGLYRTGTQRGLVIFTRAPGLPRTIIMQGEVVARGSGRALAGAHVRISTDATRTATTAADGLFVLVSRTPASEGNTPYTVTITHPTCSAFSDGPYSWGALPAGQHFEMECP